MAGWLGRMLTGAKSAVFERGRLIYWLNILAVGDLAFGGFAAARAG